MPQDTRDEASSRITRQEKAESHSRQQANHSIENHVAVMSQRSSALDNPEGAKEQRSGSIRGQVLDANSNVVVQSVESDRSTTSDGKGFNRNGASVVSGTIITSGTPSATSDSRVTEKFSSSAPPTVHPSVKTGNKDSRSQRYRDDCVRRLGGSDRECNQKSRKMAQNSAHQGSYLRFEETSRSNGGRGVSKYGSSRSVSPGCFDRPSQFHYTASIPHELSRRQGRWPSGAFCETPPYRAAQDYGNNKSSMPRSKMAKNFTNLHRGKIATDLRTHLQPLVSSHERSLNAERVQRPGVDHTEEKQDAPKEVRLDDITENKPREIGSHEVYLVRQKTTVCAPAVVSNENVLPNNYQCKSLTSQAGPHGVADACTSVLSQMTNISSGLSGLNLAENDSAAQDAGSEETVTHRDLSKYADDSFKKTQSENVQLESSNTEVNVTPTLQRIGLKELTAVYSDAVPSGCTDFCLPDNIHYDVPSQRSTGREAKDAMNESTSSISNAEIQEEMSRAKRMSLPVNFERDSTFSAGTYLNPSAHEFAPTLTDGFGNRFSMSSSKGVVYFRPDALYVDLSRVVTQVNSDSRNNEGSPDQFYRNTVQSDYTIPPADAMPSSLPHLNDGIEILNNNLQSSDAYISNELQDSFGLYNQPTQMYNLSYYDPVSSEFPVNFPQNVNSNPLEQSMNNATIVFSYPYPQPTGYEHLAPSQENSLNYIDTLNSMQGYTSFSSNPQCTFIDPRLQVNMAAPDTMPASSNIPVTHDSVLNQFYTLVNTFERCLPQIGTQHPSHVITPAQSETTLHGANLPYHGVPLQYFETCSSRGGTFPQMDMAPTSLLTGQQVNTSSAAAQTGLVLTPQMPIGSVPQPNMWQTQPVFHPQTHGPAVSTSTPSIPTTQRPILPSCLLSSAHNAQAGGVNNGIFIHECPAYSVHSSLPKATDFQASASTNFLHNHIQVGPGQTNDGSSRPLLGLRDPTGSMAFDGAQRDLSNARHQTDPVSESVIRATVEKLFSFLKTSNVDSLWSAQQSLTDQDKSDICTVQTLVGFLNNLQRNFPNMTDGDLKEMLLMNLEALMKFYERPNMAGNKGANQSANQNQGNVLPSKTGTNQIPAHLTISHTQLTHPRSTERAWRRQLGTEISFHSESYNSTPSPFSAKVSETEPVRTSTSAQRTASRGENVSQISTLSGRRPPVANVRGCRRPPQAHHGRQKLYSASENNPRPGQYAAHWSSDRPLRRNL